VDLGLMRDGRSGETLARCEMGTKSGTEFTPSSAKANVPTLNGSANDERHPAIHPQQCALLQKCWAVPERFFAHHGQTLPHPNVHSAVNDDSLTAASAGKDASGEASLHAAATNDV